MLGDFLKLILTQMHAGAEVINQNHHHVYVGRMKAENYCKLDD